MDLASLELYRQTSLRLFFGVRCLRGIVYLNLFLRLFRFLVCCRGIVLAHSEAATLERFIGEAEALDQLFLQVVLHRVRLHFLNVERHRRVGALAPVGSLC